MGQSIKLKNILSFTIPNFRLNDTYNKQDKIPIPVYPIKCEIYSRIAIDKDPASELHDSITDFCKDAAVSRLILVLYKNIP
jgi:hypothetical protein